MPSFFGANFIKTFRRALETCFHKLSRFEAAKPIIKKLLSQQQLKQKQHNNRESPRTMAICDDAFARITLLCAQMFWLCCQ